MRPARLLRSTPFRLALTFGFLFTVAFLTAGVVTYELLKRELFQALDTSVNDTYSVVSSTYAMNDMEDLTAAVSTYASLSNSEHQVFLLLDKNGNRLAGKISPVSISEGMSSLTSQQLGLEGEDRFRIKAGHVGDNLLIVGQSFTETEDLEQIALVSFAWASVIIVMLAFGGGAYLATQAQRRLEGIEVAMSGVANGNLSVRIPLSGKGDDIDIVSTHMNGALDRLSGLVEGMRQVSADIAHDLKTPLNRLRLTIEQALDLAAQGKDVQDHLYDAREESDRINETFEALLRISQIEAGARKTRFRPVDLGEIMASVAEIYKSVAEDSDQSLEFSVDSSKPCIVNGDRELLTQLFVNLVENSINHCPSGTSIRMTLAARDRHFVASVADTGPGIPAEERELVFRRLYRLDKSRSTPGSGLGLSLVKAIADLHSARIHLGENGPGAAGLAVSLSFPSQQDKA